MSTKPSETQSTTENGSVFVAGTIDEWKTRRRIPATLPSGMNVVLRTVSLHELAAEDGLPEDLLHIALLEMTPLGVSGEIAREMASQSEEALERAKKLSRDAVSLRDRLVLRAVEEPQIGPADLADLDWSDKAMIADIASRQTDVDATGRRVYGEQPIATFPGSGGVE